MKRNRKYRLYSWIFFTATFTPLILVGLLNLIINPYGAFTVPDIPGVSHKKSRKENNDRLYKAIDITRIKPITILLGSSRTKQGLDPDNPRLAQYQPVYNSAIDAPNTYELRRYLEHALANQNQLKTVIVGIDFLMFNKNLKNQSSFLDNRLGKRHILIQDAINVIFSLDALLASQETITESKNSSYKANNTNRNGFVPDSKDNDDTIKSQFNTSINFYSRIYSHYEFSEEYLNDFKNIVEICNKNNIELKVFISPSHATQWETIYIAEKWDTFERWKREVVKVIPLWDFSGYNSVTSEEIKEDMDNYRDSSHYTKSIGDLIINRIFSYQQEQVPKDFGILLTPQNIELHLAEIRSQQKVWRKENPEEVEMVKEIKESVTSQLETDVVP